MKTAPDLRINEGKILIVDDNPDAVAVLERMLKHAGYKSIRSVTDPREAIGLYQTFKPDVVLLDIDMPHLDGFQVMETLNEIEKGGYLSVLVISGRGDHSSLLRALESGAKDFIDKPFERMEALSRIRNMLEIRLLHNQVLDHNRQLEDVVHERTKELQSTRLEIIRRLGRAAEYRDNETGAHIIRLSKMCYLLGKAAGMNETRAELLLHASPMHDVGKIGIPDRILLKPGKLDPDEFEVIKTHTTIGGELLSGHHSDLLIMAKEIALTHHEKCDGTGYPNGLKREKIFFEGRICAICDVFDALTSVRPYKKAWSVEDAIEEINRSSGTHFDPELVERFNEILPGIRKIKDTFA